MDNIKLDVDEFLNPRPTGVCPNAYGPQKALVAASTVSTGRVVVACTCGVYLDMHEAGVDAGDSWGDDFKDGEVTVWEGRIAYSVTPSSPNGPEEFDGPDYEGDFRPPTDEEWSAIRAGRNPWPCALCDGTGYVPPKEEPKP